ncbi:MAG: hypothetical protein E5X74_10115 [Mesorhizobium sp.]|uniref:hypothetical protein n=1 Tax=Mesorhizobium sp. TaxID=1871066 RepID=UPI0011F97D0E|nr:hypothetical protein [Mesorhizobium sp.]TIO79347.1 MAG: hypothetical protein E5X75_01990 [Mesorhizobium sp.]TIO85961.1 MAG: hypothetical protein E5X74_10115 [Mesorhizobium sp.]
MPKARGRKSKARPKRRVAITEEYIADIREFIVEWRGVPTWEDIVNEAERVCGHKWSRQGLNKHKEIVDAYHDKVSTKSIMPHVAEGDLAIMHLEEKVQQKEVELQQLRRQLKTYDELFVRYQANAHRRGITPEELERPLEKVERRR